MILDNWWPETLHSDIRKALGLSGRGYSKKRAFCSQFRDEVLQNYRYSCAFCGFHALLNGQHTGVDAAHIKWSSANGPDIIGNGIALCKCHQWAYDKGILSFNNKLRISVSSYFVTQGSGHVSLETLHNQGLAVIPTRTPPVREYCEWHLNNIYLGN
jgi:putative restriction endonuclease